MKNLILQLLSKYNSTIKSLIILIVVLGFFDKFYSDSFIWFFSISWVIILLWLLFKILFKVVVDSATYTLKIIPLDESEDFEGKYFIVSVLFGLSTRFVLHFGLPGALFLLAFLITFLLRTFITLAIRYKSNLDVNIVFILLMFYIIWHPFKLIVKQEFGVNKIGHVFQSNEFRAINDCEIYNLKDFKPYFGKADLLMSHKLTEEGITEEYILNGFVDDYVIRSYSIENAIVYSVSFNNKVVNFKNCIITIDSDDNVCTCEKGIEYNIELLLNK